jgi:Uma2 family endonuclease
MSAPAEVAFSRRRVVEPDVFVVPLVEGKLASRFEEVGRLTLVVEVISPSSARSDRYKKRHLYQSEGVPEYWIVDADARYVERWRPSDEVLIETLEWKPLENEPPLVIDLAALFRKVYGEGERGDTA